MKVAFIADVHVGNHRAGAGPIRHGVNDRCRLVLKALDEAMRRAEVAGCQTMVILGDVFDTLRPTPQMIAEVQQCLESRMPVVVLMGNHDQESTHPGDHALAPLHRWRNVRVVEAPEVLTVGLRSNLVLVPFRPGPASLWCPADVGSLADSLGGDAARNVLCLHLGIRDGSEAAFMAKTEDSIEGKTLAGVCRDFNIGHVIAGNWHFRKRWTERGVHLFQCGTVAPTGWDNPGLEGHGTLAIFDSASGEWSWEEIPGPRFLKAAGVDAGRAMLREAKAAKAAGHTVFVRWAVPKEYLADAREAVEDYRAEVVPDGVDAKVAARSAAATARSADTLEAAISGYIENMDLEDGVDRADVLNRCRGYLAQ